MILYIKNYSRCSAKAARKSNSPSGRETAWERCGQPHSHQQTADHRAHHGGRDSKMPQAQTQPRDTQSSRALYQSHTIPTTADAGLHSDTPPMYHRTGRTAAHTTAAADGTRGASTRHRMNHTALGLIA
ncbi:Hypothetical predicted protein [Pelobates cultripes]|uniref:Uncharacterized protein n=1 Tax=Pelobates cultripes TaxID=61616 RepID=A0AAD1SAH0_PELCU|nr:Hypothetical predicted protein [Pelobates cultripes]